MIECLFKFIEELLVENKILIMSYLIYQLISYLSSKIDISSFSYNGKDSNENIVDIFWFNAKNNNTLNSNGNIERYENLYYRFKIDIVYFNPTNNPTNKPKLTGHILILNKRDILFIDRIKILYFFTCEYIKDIICEKIGATRKKGITYLVFEKIYIS